MANAIAAKFIKEKEQCRLTAYKDIKGVWTIGWGATGPDIKEGLVWTQAQADARFDSDLAKFEKAVSMMLKVQLSEMSRAALVSFAYNLGERALRDSTLMVMLNGKDYLSAAQQFQRWCYDDGDRIKGLLIRRLEEAILFLKGL